jgi:hypothetical protein
MCDCFREPCVRLSLQIKTVGLTHCCWGRSVSRKRTVSVARARREAYLSTLSDAHLRSIRLRQKSSLTNRRQLGPETATAHE